MKTKLGGQVIYRKNEKELENNLVQSQGRTVLTTYNFFSVFLKFMQYKFMILYESTTMFNTSSLL